MRGHLPAAQNTLEGESYEENHDDRVGADHGLGGALRLRRSEPERWWRLLQLLAQCARAVLPAALSAAAVGRRRLAQLELRSQQPVCWISSSGILGGVRALVLCREPPGPSSCVPPGLFTHRE